MIDIKRILKLNSLSNQIEIRVYLQVTNFDLFRNIALWKQTEPRWNCQIVKVLIPILKQSKQSTGMKNP